MARRPAAAVRGRAVFSPYERYVDFHASATPAAVVAAEFAAAESAMPDPQPKATPAQ